MAVYSPVCHPTVKTGLVDIKVSLSAASQSLLNLGIATDYIEISDRPFLLDVPSDRGGGSQGTPHEIQYLGHIVTVRFALSTYTQATVDFLKQRSVNATKGKILQSEVGKFLLETSAVRLLLHTSDANQVRNFWCAIPRDPIDVGIGTKYSEKRFAFTCYRPPCGHFKADILEDTDSDPS